MIREMTKKFNVYLEEEGVPDEWKKTLIIPLFKNKGGKLECENYRGISLLSVPSKTFMRVLLNKVNP